MQVSIVIPSYNAGRYIGTTIDSVLAQTFEDWELVISDDGSTDATLEVATSYAARDSRIRVTRHPNGGVAVARNAGLAETCPASTYVTFLDHDDLWEPQLLARLREALDAHPECVAAYSLARFVDETGQPIRCGELEQLELARREITPAGLRDVQPHEPTTFAVEAFWNRITTPGQVLIRREAIEKVGPFDPATVPADDYDMWLRLCSIGSIWLVPDVLYGYRQHGTNASHDHEAMAAAFHRIHRKFARGAVISRDQRRLVVRGQLLDFREKLGYSRRAIEQRQVGQAAAQCRYALGALARYLRNAARV